MNSHAGTCLSVAEKKTETAANYGHKRFYLHNMDIESRLTVYLPGAAWQRGVFSAWSVVTFLSAGLLFIALLLPFPPPLDSSS